MRLGGLQLQHHEEDFGETKLNICKMKHMRTNQQAAHSGLHILSLSFKIAQQCDLPESIMHWTSCCSDWTPILALITGRLLINSRSCQWDSRAGSGVYTEGSSILISAWLFLNPFRLGIVITHRLKRSYLRFQCWLSCCHEPKLIANLSIHPFVYWQPDLVT